jgi:hypothetical protein
MRVSIVGSSADQEACSLYIKYADQADDKADVVLLNAYKKMAVSPAANHNSDCPDENGKTSISTEKKRLQAKEPTSGKQPKGKILWPDSPGLRSTQSLRKK